MGNRIGFYYSYGFYYLDQTGSGGWDDTYKAEHFVKMPQKDGWCMAGQRQLGTKRI